MHGQFRFKGQSSHFASPDFYAGAIRPAGMAHVLPNAAFRSLAFARLEDLAVWTQDWICVGTLDDIPAVGDLLPFTVGTHGLHVQRMASGISARFNKAQHGGCRQVPVQCQTGSKTKCSFTSCGYSLDRGAIATGELGDGTPAMHQYLGLRPERLLTARAVEWGPFIFITLDPAAKDFSCCLADLDRDVLAAVGRSRKASHWNTASANWKLVGQALVGGTQAGESVTAQSSHWWCRRADAGSGQELALWLFPNLLLLSHGEEICAIVLQPIAVGRTLCRVSIYGSSTAAADVEARWTERLAPLLRQAEEDQEAASRWGTVSSPETIGAPLPRQERPQGIWMQQMTSRRMTALTPSSIDLQTYELTRP